MAKRGTPLPFALREQIKAKATEQSQRKTAEELRVSRNTVRKYVAKRV